MRYELATFLVILLSCTRLAPGVADPVLREEFLAMRDADQRMLRLAAAGRAEPSERTRFAERVERLRALLDAHRWPTYAEGGRDAAAGAWLVAHHADEDPGLQTRALAAMEAATSAGQADPVLIACLRDRVLLHAGQPQWTGTQGTGGARSETERDAIDARRKALGLPSLAQASTNTFRS